MNNFIIELTRADNDIYYIKETNLPYSDNKCFTKDNKKACRFTLSRSKQIVYSLNIYRQSFYDIRAKTKIKIRKI